MWMRKAGNVLTLISLLLLVGVVVLWVRGERQEDAIVIESRFIFGNRSQMQWSSFDGKIIACEPEVIDYGDTIPPVFRVKYDSGTLLQFV